MTRFFSASAAFLVVLSTSGFISPAHAQDKSTPPAAKPSGVFPIPKVAMVDFQKIFILLMNMRKILLTLKVLNAGIRIERIGKSVHDWKLRQNILPI